MKKLKLLSILLAVLVVAGVTTTVEARHHHRHGPNFSLNIGGLVAPAVQERYVVDYYPAYYAQPVYVQPTPYYVQPAPQVVYVAPQPVVRQVYTGHQHVYPSIGLGLGFSWFFR